jgi:2-C-methyl-D-erythritol 4-phosphate cytidylyltransferase
MSCYIIIPAGGIGKRFGSKLPKQFYKINGKEIIIRTIEKFLMSRNVSGIYVAMNKKYLNYFEKLLKKYDLTSVVIIVQGGKIRQDSVFNALGEINARDEDIILVHDAVRPYLSVKLINKVIKCAEKKNTAVPVLNVNDTVKKVGNNNSIDKTLDRNEIKLAQTPQAFKYYILLNSFIVAHKNKFIGTDESSIVEYCGYKVHIIPGEENNIKITKKTDIRNKL